MPSLESYLSLISSQHRAKPNFVAFVTNLLTVPVALQTAIASLPASFDLDNAVGVQLDQLGQWINQSRYIETPLPNVYFSFDTPGLGFDQGLWFGPYDPVEGLTTLDDTHYRLLLRAKIASNHWDGTLAQAVEILAELFLAADAMNSDIQADDQTILMTDDGQDLLIDSYIDPATQTLVFIQDDLDMHAVIGIAGLLPDALSIGLITGGYIDLRALGVKIDYAVTSVNGAPIFGFDVDNGYVGGFDVGAWSAPPIPRIGANN